MNTDALHAFYHFDPRPVDAWIFNDHFVWKKIEAQICACPSFVFPSNDNPLAICGIVLNGTGAGEVWMITANGFERKAALIMDQLRTICQSAFAWYGLHRIHMAVDAQRDDAARFAVKLGFRFEARLKGLGTGGRDVDFYLFERKV